MTSAKVYIYTVDGGKRIAQAGLYAIRFRRYCPERALCIKHRDGKYSVYLDGKMVADPCDVWMIAMGWIYQQHPAFLSGRTVDAEEYKALVYHRNMDILKGVDLDIPQNPNETRVAI